MLQRDRQFLVIAKMETVSVKTFQNLIGKKLGISKWYLIEQGHINQFADVTGDHQFIHVDPQKATKTAFGTTIAHGFLTLSMLSSMSYNAIPRIDRLKMGVNYGFNKIRFISPVPVGSRIRGHFTLFSSKVEKPGELTNIVDVSVEIQNNERPALVAEWISRQFFEE